MDFICNGCSVTIGSESVARQSLAVTVCTGRYHVGPFTHVQPGATVTRPEVVVTRNAVED